MPATAKGIRYPDPSAAPNIPQDMANLAVDVDNRLPGAWVNVFLSDLAYTWTPSATATWQNLANMTGTTSAIPAGRSVDVEFDSPAAWSVSGYFFMRLLIGGVVKRAGWWANSRSPVHLGADAVGTGAALSIAVQGHLANGTGGVESSGLGPTVLRYRIV